MLDTEIKEFLSKKHIKYATINHTPTYTAQETAASAHVPGQQLAKTVIVKGDGRFVMVVEPAHRRVDLEALKEVLGAKQVELASEYEFQGKFPDCEVGAMPPLGNLFDMDVYVDEALSGNEQIAFNDGRHSELISISYEDFEKLVKPKVFGTAAA